MKTEEFLKWSQNLGLSRKALNRIENIRSCPPSRRVQGRGKNVSGVYPSSKMGVTIQFESHKVELWAIYQMEQSAEVLEFYDQPEPFLINYLSQTGRKITHYHTPDFFVLRTDGAGWEEWKTEKELCKLTKKYPSRYCRAETGEWRSPPGERYAEEMGLYYRIRSDAEFNPIFIQNLIFLEDYFKCETKVAKQKRDRLLEEIRSQPGITLEEILKIIPLLSADDVYAMIARNQFYTDFDAIPLVKQKQVKLYQNQETAIANLYLSSTNAQNKNKNTVVNLERLEANTKLHWDGQIWTLINFGTTIVTLLPTVGQPIQLPQQFFIDLINSGGISLIEASFKSNANSDVNKLMTSASPEALAIANHRFQVVQAYLEKRYDLTSNIVPRTLRRWVKKFRDAEAKYGCGYVGLLPRISDRGNRRPKAPLNSSELLDKYIAEYYQTPRQAPAISVYRAYELACTQKEISALSSSTFYKRLKKYRTYSQTKKRIGTKAAYSLQSWVWELSRTTPRHGERPFDIAHIDHTQLDIELRKASDGTRTRKALAHHVNGCLFTSNSRSIFNF